MICDNADPRRRTRSRDEAGTIARTRASRRRGPRTGAAVVALFFLVSVLACAQRAVGRLDSVELRFVREGLPVASVSVEVAVSDAEKERGLMFRKELDDGKGMIFVFSLDRKLSFWMKDTELPLSIGFISYDGKLLQIDDMDPRSLRVVESERSARYALEVPRGWFGRVGVAVGDVLDLEPLSRYLAASGKKIGAN